MAQEPNERDQIDRTAGQPTLRLNLAVQQGQSETRVSIGSTGSSFAHDTHLRGIVTSMTPTDALQQILPSRERQHVFA